MRIWRTSPFVAIVAVTALSMGIGFTTTMFSIVHGATRPLPFANPDQLVAIEKLARRNETADASTRPYDYAVWAAAPRSFSALGAYESIALNLAGEQPERITGAAVTASTFEMLPAAAILGRTILSSDNRVGAPPVVVLSHSLWQRRFGASSQIVGTTIRLSGVPHEVVGVMPRRFGFPVNSAFWTPLAVEGGAWQPRTGPRLRAFGRLVAGASIDTARAELDALTDAARVRVMPFQDIETPPEVIRSLYLLLVAVSFVLLIACSNVANLLLARAAVRARDAAVRLAIGAARRQLILEQLGETASLAAAAALIGLGLAHAGTQIFAANTSHIIEAFWVDFRVDTTVLLFASMLAGVATLAAGLGPALRVSRGNVAEVLKDRSYGASSHKLGRLTRGMMGVQVALACGLLALTMVMARTAVNIRTVDWPFDPASTLTFEFEVPERLADDVTARNRRIREIATALSATPGVTAAGLTTALPGRGGGDWSFSLDTAPVPATALPTTAVSFVSPEFFAVANARPRAGRLITSQDDETAPRIAVVNESFVRRFSANRDPIGRRIYIGARDFTIVGIVPDLMARDVQEQQRDGVYTPIFQSRPFGIRAMVAGGEPLSMVPSIRAALRRVDSDMPISEIFTLQEAVYRDKRILDVLSALFLTFGVGALSLTAIGLYGVVSFAVTQRTREIGIRVALGATRAQVMQLVVGQGGRQLLVGLAAGMPLAVGLSRGFAAAVEQMPVADLPLLLLIAAAVSVTAAAALVMPARHAATVQILQALRSE
jgi:putative ABC transport system permease protein